MNTAHPHTHYIHRAGWLRAAVLGANDGIISTSSLLLGIAATEPTGNLLVLDSQRMNNSLVKVTVKKLAKPRLKSVNFTKESGKAGVFYGALNGQPGMFAGQ